MTQLFTNNAESVLAMGMTAAATTLTVKAGEGVLFPNPLNGDFFLITLFQRVGAIEMNWEIVKCTARAGDVLTVERMVEGSTPRAFNAGDPVSLRLTAGAVLPVYQGALTGALNEAVPVPVIAASSMAIASAGANTLIVSGVASIVTFDAAPPGAVRRMVFTDAATLVHNAVSMNLTTGADIVTARGDCAEWISGGKGNWSMLSYTRASGSPVGVVPMVQTVAGQTATGTALITAADAAAARAAIGVSASNYAPGDLLTSVRKMAVPDWLPCDGKPYLKSSYPALYGAVGPAAAGIIKLAAPVSPPVASSAGCAFTADGQILAMAQATAPYLILFKRSGDTFSRLPLAAPPSSFTYKVAFNADNTLMAVAHSASPFLSMYKRSGDTFTLSSVLTVNPAATSKAVAFSPDGNFLACGDDTSGINLRLYARNGESFYLVGIPAPKSNVFSIAFSADGLYMAVALQSAPTVMMYKRAPNGLSYVALPDQTVPAPNGVYGVAFSPDGAVLGAALSSGSYLCLFSRDGDKFTKLPDPAILPTGQSTNLAFSPDGGTLAVGHGTAPFLTMYTREGTTFTKWPSYTTPGGGVQHIAYTSDGAYFALGMSEAPYMAVYSVPYDAATQFLVPTLASPGGGFKQYIKT
ncbi:WD40 repeat domain-containing protein [Massilia antarctica]|uniref:WD40 repeat domain-containing protein n=1 Tax=Massilia antarctica TaxID=2765360 RepID=UPI0035E78D98